MARLDGLEDKLIKEAPSYPSQVDLRVQIAKEYFERTGIQLTDEDVEKLLPIVQSELMMELSLYNSNAVRDKECQIIISDLLSFKPKATI